MPRELLHWKVLSLATGQLPEGALRSSLLKHPAVAQIGAMAPDAPYYFRLGGTAFEEVAETIHGAHGEDTFEPVRKMLLALPTLSPTFELAFIAGFLSHLVTDIYFHPLVYALSGNYYDAVPEKRKQARAAHRLVETFFDEIVRAQKSDQSEISLLGLQQQLSLETLQAVEQLLESALPSQKRDWRPALRHMHFLQHIFVNRGYSLAAHAINAICFGKLVDKVVLFRPLTTVPPELSASIDYCDPVTGERRQTSVDSLTHAAVTRLVELLLLIQNQLTAGNVNVLQNIQGESLNTGTLGGRNSQMRYFSENPAWLF